MTARGFGVAGALDHQIAATLSVEAEAAGFSTFWANDTPGGDGLAALAAAAKATTSIGLGVGVIPIDRVPAAQIIARVEKLKLPQDRLVIGIGSGGLTKGARVAVEQAAIELDKNLTARIIVGALGPRMCEIGGRSSDGVLLNWLSTDYLPTLAGLVRETAVAANRPLPWISAYVRVALTGSALERLNAEAGRYASYPQYAAHFERMGVRAIDTCVSGSAEDIEHGLAAFPLDADEVVARAIAADESLDAYVELLRAAAPKGTRPT